MKSLFGRNINILRTSKASVLSKLNFLAGLLSLLNTTVGFCLIPFQFLSVYLAPQFAYDLLIINPLFENLL